MTEELIGEVLGLMGLISLMSLIWGSLPLLSE
jgi:hypothetical protein